MWPVRIAFPYKAPSALDEKLCLRVDSRALVLSCISSAGEAAVAQWPPEHLQSPGAARKRARSSDERQSGLTDDEEALLSALWRCVRRGTLALAPRCESASRHDAKILLTARVSLEWRPPDDTDADLDSSSIFADLRRVLEAVFPPVLHAAGPPPQPLAVDVKGAVSACATRYTSTAALLPCISALRLTDTGSPVAQGAATASMFPYQRQAAHWMVVREVGGAGGLGTRPLSAATTAARIASAHEMPAEKVISSARSPLAAYASDLLRVVSERYGPLGSHRRTHSRARSHILWTPLPPSALDDGRAGAELDRSPLSEGPGSPPLFWQMQTGAVVCEAQSGADGAGLDESSTFDGLQGVGGLVCDETGLGKTLEVLALVCAHPLTEQPWLHRPPGAATSGPMDPYGDGAAGSDAVDGTQLLADGIATTFGEDPKRLAAELDTVASAWLRMLESDASSAADFEGAEQPAGAVAAEALPHFLCRATLVVVPSNILRQWAIDEVAKWAPFLAVHVYGGVKGIVSGSAAAIRAARRRRRRSSTGAPPPPSPEHDCNLELAAVLCADVVLTSFDTLHADLFHAGGRRLEAPKAAAAAYPAVRSPLFSAVFHRVVLDESHMVGGGGASAAARMALTLLGRYRWCVSGTPLENPADLCNTLAFLRHRPFGERIWARTVLLPALSPPKPVESLSDADPPASGSLEPRDVEPPPPRSALVGHLLRRFGSGRELLDAVLRPILWRNTKVAVALAGELELPPLTFVLLRLALTAVERQFYLAVEGATAALRTQLDDADDAGPAATSAVADPAPPDPVPAARHDDDADMLPFTPGGAGAEQPDASASDALQATADGPSQSLDVSAAAPSRPYRGHSRVGVAALDSEGRLRARQSAALQLRMACVHGRLCSLIVSRRQRAGAAPPVDDSGAPLPGHSADSPAAVAFKLGSFRRRSRPRRDSWQVSKTRRRRRQAHGSLLRDAGGDGEGGLVRDSMLDLISSLVDLAALDVERARLAVFRSLQQLGAVLEQRAAAAPSPADACPLLEEAAAAYREGRGLSAATVISRASFAEENTAVRPWVHLDIASLAGLQRTLARLGSADEAAAADDEILRGVIAPFMSARLRLQFAFCLVNLRDVVLRLDRPPAAWLDEAWLASDAADGRVPSEVRGVGRGLRRDSTRFLFPCNTPAGARGALRLSPARCGSALAVLEARPRRLETACGCRCRLGAQPPLRRGQRRRPLLR